MVIIPELRTIAHVGLLSIRWNKSAETGRSEMIIRARLVDGTAMQRRQSKYTVRREVASLLPEALIKQIDSRERLSSSRVQLFRFGDSKDSIGGVLWRGRPVLRLQSLASQGLSGLV